MLLKIKELKNLLSSIDKYKIENVNITSQNFQLIVNTIKSRTPILQKQSDPEIYFNKSKHQQNIKTIQEKKIISINPEQGQYFTIVSPMTGTFYRSPAPNEAPFININDRVKFNQTVCIIEAMKLMNEIESEVNGHIAEILVEDGDIVDCGQALIKIKQDK